MFLKEKIPEIKCYTLVPKFRNPVYTEPDWRRAAGANFSVCAAGPGLVHYRPGWFSRPAVTVMVCLEGTERFPASAAIFRQQCKKNNLYIEISNNSIYIFVRC